MGSGGRPVLDLEDVIGLEGVLASRVPPEATPMWPVAIAAASDRAGRHGQGAYVLGTTSAVWPLRRAGCWKDRLACPGAKRDVSPATMMSQRGDPRAQARSATRVVCASQTSLRAACLPASATKYWKIFPFRCKTVRTCREGTRSPGRSCEPCPLQSPLTKRRAIFSIYRSDRLPVPEECHLPLRFYVGCSRSVASLALMASRLEWSGPQRQRAP